MHAKERFEGVQVALPKLVQDAARLVLHPPFPFSPLLRDRKKKGYIQRAAAMRILSGNLWAAGLKRRILLRRLKRFSIEKESFPRPA
jgi:hypothetical protein